MKNAIALLKEITDSKDVIGEYLKQHPYDMDDINNLLFLAEKLNKELDSLDTAVTYVTYGGSEY